VDVPQAPVAAATQGQYSQAYRGKELRGSADFISRTEAALDLLSGSTTFALVSPYIAVIEEADHSGMQAGAAKPAFQVGKATWSQPAAWYAGTISHDGRHSALYHAAKAAARGEPPADTWTGAAAEKDCLALQLKVLAQIKAPPYMLQYVRSLLTDPAYQQVPYDHRDW
jgi:hypothetical protein